MPRLVSASGVRKPLLEAAQTNVLTKSRRRCCLCFWLDGMDEPVKGQIAHLDKDRTNSSEDNLAFLCLRHHDEYDSIPKQSKGLREKEVRHWRDELAKEMAFRFKEFTAVAERRRNDFEYLKEIMGDLLASMRKQLKKAPLTRYMALIGHGTTITSEWLLLIFKYHEIPQLREKFRILHNYGLVQRERDEDNAFWLTEELARYLVDT